MTFLLEIYRTKKSTLPFITDIAEAESESEAKQKLLNKKYFFDSEQRRLLGTCRKAEVVTIID